ncbi:hypothetical protein, conserved [Eimeria praecox]|uniref:Uncharacterized protein n=1 Tax=Eimeria praecox TaxID=51316 RepID=U6HAT6_9EIME|nr:hypothetical protein, conserved [Eimeria praecox]
MWFFSGSEGRPDAPADEPPLDQSPDQPGQQEQPPDKTNENSAQEPGDSSSGSPWAFWEQLAAGAHTPGDSEEAGSLTSATSSDNEGGTQPLHMSSTESAASSEQHAQAEGRAEHEEPDQQASGWGLWGQLVGIGAAAPAASDAHVAPVADVEPNASSDEDSASDTADPEEQVASTEQSDLPPAAAAVPGVFNWGLLGEAASWIQPHSAGEEEGVTVSGKEQRGGGSEIERGAPPGPASLSGEPQTPHTPQRRAEDTASGKEDAHSLHLSSSSGSSSADESRSETEAGLSLPVSPQQARPGGRGKPGPGIKDSHLSDDETKQNQDTGNEEATAKSRVQVEPKGARPTRAKPSPPPPSKLGKAQQESSDVAGTAAASQQQPLTEANLKQGAAAEQHPAAAGEQPPAAAPPQHQQTAAEETHKGAGTAAQQQRAATKDQPQEDGSSYSKDPLGKRALKADAALPHAGGAAATAAAANSPLAKLLAHRLPKHSGSFVERSLPDGTTIIVSSEDGGVPKPKAKPPSECGLLLPPPPKEEGCPKEGPYHHPNKREDHRIQQPVDTISQQGIHKPVQQTRLSKPKPPMAATSGQPLPSESSPHIPEDIRKTSAKPAADPEHTDVTERTQEGSPENQGEDEDKAKSVGKVPLPPKALGAKGPPPSLPKGGGLSGEAERG